MAYPDVFYLKGPIAIRRARSLYKNGRFLMKEGASGLLPNNVRKPECSVLFVVELQQAEYSDSDSDDCVNETLTHGAFRCAQCSWCII